MQFLVLFACALAAASASHIVAPLATVYQHKLEHLPLIDHEGVPVDTAAVQHAKAAHLVHKINVAARNGDHAVITGPVAHSAVVAHAAPVAHSAVVAHAAPVVAVAHSGLVAHSAPIVAHSAVVAHQAPVVAHSAVVAHSSVIAHPAPAVAYAHSSPLISSVVAPVVAHSAPVVSYSSLNHHSAHGLLYRKRRGVYLTAAHGYHGPQHLPIINHQGVPVDTAEVQIARAAHLAHKHNVHAHRDGHVVYGHHAVAPIVQSVYAHSYATPLATYY